MAARMPLLAVALDDWRMLERGIAEYQSRRRPKPHLSPVTCPGCWRIVCSCTHDDNGLRCGDCGARVKVSVVRITSQLCQED